MYVESDGRRMNVESDGELYYLDHRVTIELERDDAFFGLFSTDSISLEDYSLGVEPITETCYAWELPTIMREAAWTLNISRVSFYGMGVLEQWCEYFELKLCDGEGA